MTTFSRLAGFLLGIVHDRRLMRRAQTDLAIRWFAGYRLDEPLPNHSSLTATAMNLKRLAKANLRFMSLLWRLLSLHSGQHHKLGPYTAPSQIDALTHAAKQTNQLRAA